MKLAVVSSHPIQYQVPLFRELARRPGVEFRALFCDDHGLAPSFDPMFRRTFAWDVPVLDGYEHTFLANVARHPGPSTFGLVNPDILRILWKGELDAIVLHGYSVVTTMAASIGPRRHTRVLMRGDSNPRDPRSLLRRAVKEPVVRGIFSRIDHFLPIGALNVEYFRKYGVRDADMTFAPFSVDNAFFAEKSRPTSEDRGAVRARYGLPNDVPLFLFAGKLQPKKRPLDLVRAFSEAGLAGRAGIVYVGDGELSQELALETSRLGLGDCVFTFGFRNQSEIPLFYGLSDAVVVPSDIEPWGLVVNEAMACGAAAIVTDVVGSGPDLVRDRGAIYPVGDVSALAAILTRAVDDPAWLAKLRQDASERIRGWGVKETADGFLAGAAAAMERPARWI